MPSTCHQSRSTEIFSNMCHTSLYVKTMTMKRKSSSHLMLPLSINYSPQTWFIPITYFLLEYGVLKCHNKSITLWAWDDVSKFGTIKSDIEWLLKIIFAILNLQILARVMDENANAVWCCLTAGSNIFVTPWSNLLDAILSLKPFSQNTTMASDFGQCPKLTQESCLTKYEVNWRTKIKKIDWAALFFVRARVLAK